MTDQTTEPVNEEMNSLLNMSDEELMNLDTSFLDADKTEDETSVEDSSDEEPGDSQGDEIEEEDGELDNKEQDTDDSTDSGETVEEDSEEDTDETEADETEETETDQESENEEDSTVDYKAFYEQLTAPFKANGKEMKVDNVDDALQLMQMGAGFNKKMAALKPNLKMLKLLEKNNLLDEQKLSYLIDLDKKNPDAITKLIKESGIDPLDIDTQSESEYKPETYTVDDRELALDEAIAGIKGTEHFDQTIDLITNKWDGPSKRIVAENPQLLSVINGHMASGVYDVISNAVEDERTFGRLNGLGDLEAYRQVGDALQAKGAFDHLFQEQNQEKPKQVIKPKAKSDPKLKSKKRAASSTKSTSSQQKEVDLNPLSMSDEDFEKVGLDKFL
jgi:hypothetical protein